MNDNTLEIGLIEKWQKDGCIKSRNTVVMKYEALCKRTARKFSFGGTSEIYEDLVQQGILGVIDALNKFDTTRDIRPVTFISYSVKNHISSFVKANAGAIRHASMSNGKGKVYYHMGELPGDGIDGITYRTIQSFSEKYKVSEKEIMECLSCYAFDIEDQHIQDDSTNPGTITENIEILEIMMSMIANFNENMRKAFERRFKGGTFLTSGSQVTFAWDKELYRKGIKLLQEELHVKSL